MRASSLWRKSRQGEGLPHRFETVDVARWGRRFRLPFRVDSMIAEFIEWLMIASVRLLVGARPRSPGWHSSDQRIYVANHSSHLDAVLLYSTLPPTLRR